MPINPITPNGGLNPFVVTNAGSGYSNPPTVVVRTGGSQIGSPNTLVGAAAAAWNGNPSPATLDPMLFMNVGMGGKGYEFAFSGYNITTTDLPTCHRLDVIIEATPEAFALSFRGCEWVAFPAVVRAPTAAAVRSEFIRLTRPFDGMPSHRIICQEGRVMTIRMTGYFEECVFSF